MYVLGTNARRAVIVLVVALLGLGALPVSAAPATWVRTYDGRTGTKAITRGYLTPDGLKLFAISNRAGVVNIKAMATNHGTNHREVFWPKRQRNLVDSGVCATWTAASSKSVQQGLAFRIVSEPGRTRAITVTKNIIFGYSETINVGVW